MHCLRYAFVFLLLFLSVLLKAQSVTSYSNLRKKWISVESDTIKIDSFRIVPKSISLSELDVSQYEIDYTKGLFIWKQKPSKPILITYRVLPFKLSSFSQRMSFDSVMFRLSPKIWTPTDKITSPNDFDFGNLNYSGSFGRSLSFGNRQDVVVNSSLNLRLNGYIGDSILLAAALSDNNIPVQPDGNTQNLNEFDQVFIQFSKNNHQFNIGDIDIRPQNSRYLNFYKRLQGALYSSASKTNTLIAGAAVAKGKFTRQILNGTEGNQGPYRLKGANNEFFFIVLAGSERVWIDGVLMQRGEDQDYIINYNTAEITFTPKQMITKDKRIQVEFEYADRNYLNAQLYVNNEFNINEKWKFKVSAFSNNDAKNSPINQRLDPAQRQFLSKIGDSTQLAFYPYSTVDSFSNGKILYRKVDTLINGKKDSIYIYSTNRLDRLFQLNFIEVGSGKGNYIQDFTGGVNGKLFRWTSPDANGNKTGNFEPAIFIVAPKKQQMISIGSEYTDQNIMLSTEVAVSNQDLNTFSNIEKANDVGVAFNVQGQYKKPLRDKNKSLITEWHFERISKQFRALERLRAVEFYRDWGLPMDAGVDGETFLSGGVAYSDKQQNILKYDVGYYNRDSGYKAFRHSFIQQNAFKGWNFRNSISFTRTIGSYQKGFFFRPVLDLSRQIKTILPNYQLGVFYTIEQNESRFNKSDSLDARSFSFDVLKIYLKSPDADNKWGLNLFTRGDKLPTKNGMVKVDRSFNLNGYLDLLSNEYHQFRLNATYRKLNIHRTDLSSSKPEGTILGRSEYMFNIWRTGITGNLLYELGSGQEPRREFSYLEVPAGQGEYAWIDYNSDGLQQLNEFEQARFRDQAKYIRIFTPTSEFIRASYLQFNYSLILNPGNALRGSGLTRFEKILSKFYGQSSLQSGRKNIQNGLADFNPFESSVSDTTLITMDQLFSNTISFNRFDPTWGIDLNSLHSKGRAFLSYGFEERSLQDLKLKGRFTIKKKITLEWITRKWTNFLHTPGFSNRNFTIKGQSTEPGLTFTHETVFRIKAGCKWDKRHNNTGEQSTSRSINTEMKYNVLARTALTGMFVVSKIKFNGQPNTALSYTMLEGLLPGKNYLWTLDLTRRLTKFLELNLQYEGRKSGMSNAVHIGRAQVRALF